MSTDAGVNRITLRSIIIGLLCVAGFCRIAIFNNRYIVNTLIAGNHFPLGPLFVLTVLVILFNPLIKKTGTFSAISRGELVTIWCMMITGVSVASYGYAEYLLGTLIGPSYFATPENDWGAIFHQYIPDWLIPKKPQAITSFYAGAEEGYIPWRAWMRPLFFWTSFAFLLWWMILCLANLFRRQWVEREKFTFPLVELPMEMVQAPNENSLLNSFLKNRVLWFAAFIVLVIDSLVALNFYFPIFPRIPLRFYWYSVEKPWNAAGSILFNIIPSAIGLSCLMSIEISLSLWVFYLFHKTELVVGSATGLSPVLYHQDFIGRREMGAYAVLAGAFFFRGHSQFKAVFHAFFSGSGKRDDKNELIPFRGSLISLFFAGIGASLMLTAAGASFVLAFLCIMFFILIVAVVDTWLVTRGLFLIHGSFKAPDFFVTILGTKRIDPYTLTLIAFPKRVFFRDRRESYMPHVMNALKLSDVGSINRRHLLIAMLLATFVGVFVSYYANLKVTYHVGAGNFGGWINIRSPRQPFQELSWFLQNPSSTNWTQVGFVFVGAFFELVLVFMRRFFLWWPFHPVGFITPGHYPMTHIGFSVFLGWLIKYLLLRHGGLRLYRRARPIFFGMILGEGLAAAVWAIVGFIVGRGYNFLYY